MTRTEFIEQLRTMADKLEEGTFHFIEFGKDEATYIFGNKNYGEIQVAIGDARISMNLYYATDKEQEMFPD